MICACGCHMDSPVPAELCPCWSDHPYSDLFLALMGTQQEFSIGVAITRIKTTLGCRLCGFNSHFAALDFDHLPGSNKLFNISHAVRYGDFTVEETAEELDKCQVLCANCHRITTNIRKKAA